MATTSTPALHRRLERLQSTLHRQLSVPLRQTSATMGPQIHQAPGGRNSPVVPQKVPDHEKSYPQGHGGGRDRGLLQRILWGTDIPRVHWKDKRPHERPEGPIIRKVIPSWAWGRMTGEADRHKARSVRA
jgi:hypothetical protein